MVDFITAVRQSQPQTQSYVRVSEISRADPRTFPKTKVRVRKSKKRKSVIEQLKSPSAPMTGIEQKSVFSEVKVEPEKPKTPSITQFSRENLRLNLRTLATPTEKKPFLRRIESNLGKAITGTRGKVPEVARFGAAATKGIVGTVQDVADIGKATFRQTKKGISLAKTVEGRQKIKSEIGKGLRFIQNVAVEAGEITADPKKAAKARQSIKSGARKVKSLAIEAGEITADPVKAAKARETLKRIDLVDVAGTTAGSAAVFAVAGKAVKPIANIFNRKEKVGQIVLTGKKSVSGITTGEVTDLGAKIAYKMKFTRGKTPTEIKKFRTGKIIQTEKINKNTILETVINPNEKKATVNLYKKGKLRKTKTTSVPKSKIETIKFENLGEFEYNRKAKKLGKRIVTQEQKSGSIFNIKGLEKSRNELLKGTVTEKTKTEAVTKVGFVDRVTGKIDEGKFKIQSIERLNPKITTKPSKVVKRQPRLITENVKGDLTITKLPETITQYKTVTDFKGKLTLEPLRKQLLSDKKGTLKPLTQKVFVPDINIKKDNKFLELAFIPTQRGVLDSSKIVSPFVAAGSKAKPLPKIEIKEIQDKTSFKPLEKTIPEIKLEPKVEKISVPEIIIERKALPKTKSVQKPKTKTEVAQLPKLTAKPKTKTGVKQPKVQSIRLRFFTKSKLTLPKIDLKKPKTKSKKIKVSKSKTEQLLFTRTLTRGKKTKKRILFEPISELFTGAELR